MRILFIDTETTGLDESSNQIISYCCQIWDSKTGRGAKWLRYVQPTIPVPDEAAKINGYDPSKWAANNAVPFDHSDADFLHSVIDYDRGGMYVGGHGVDFDLRFIKAEFARLGYAPPKHHYQTIDTRPMAAPLLLAGEAGPGSMSLGKVAAFFGLDVSRAHTADGDVDLTIELWERLSGATLKGLFG